MQVPCQACKGNKKISDTVCDLCDGGGKNTIDKSFILNIEPGSENGKEKIYTNEGDQNVNEEKGDVIFVLREEKDNFYTRIGNDIIYMLTITLADSIVGFNVTIDLLDGTKFSFKEENIIEPNSYTLFKNKGFPNGDLYITYKIQYPTKILNNIEKDIIKKIFYSENYQNDSDKNDYQSGILKNNFNMEDIRRKYQNQNQNQNQNFQQNFQQNFNFTHFFNS
jgi:DnaJ-class molecular chaperone